MKQGITLQPFYFILALIVMALVLVFGIRTVNDIRGTADLTEMTTSVKRLQDQVNVFYHFDIGSSKELKLLLPKKIEQACFVNPGKQITAPVTDTFFRSILETNKKNTLYFMPLDTFAKTEYTIDHVYVNPEQNPLCIPTNGKLHVELETVFIDNQVFVEIQAL